MTQNPSGAANAQGGGACGSRESRVRDIQTLHARFDKVLIEELPWQKCVELYDDAATFFFFDPPYLTGSIKAYKMWEPLQMQELRACLDTLKANWLLTTCDSPESREVFAGLKLKSITRARGINNNGISGVQYKELIVTP